MPTKASTTYNKDNFDDFFSPIGNTKPFGNRTRKAPPDVSERGTGRKTATIPRGRGK
jgi:hypothetical protein